MIKNGVRLPLTMAQVFPLGCHLMPDSIAEAQDYDEKTKTRSPSIDKITGKRVFQCRVADMDPELEGRSRETVVKQQMTGSHAANRGKRRKATGTGRARRGPEAS